MDIDTTIIWLATRDKETLGRVREAGIKADLLVGRGKIAWDFLLEYLERHGDFPTPSVIKEHTGMEVVPPEDGTSVSYVVERIHERATFFVLRDGLAATHELLEQGRQDEAVHSAMVLAERLRSRGMSHLNIHGLNEVAPEVLSLYEQTKRGEMGVPFPWRSMNEITMGMWPKTLTFFVARPGVGKSWTAIIIADFAHFKHGLKVLIVSPEMGRVELAERVIAKRGKLNYSDLVSGRLGDFVERRLHDVVTNVGTDKGFYILDDEEKLEPQYVEAAVEAVEPDLILVDSIYMLRVEQGKVKSGPGSRGGRYDRILSTVDWLRSLSRRTDRPVVGISMLSRDVNKMKQGEKEALEKGTGTGGLEDSLAMTDTLFWDANNLFALLQDDQAREEKKMSYVPLKARRRAKMKGAIVTNWDMETMDFSEIGVEEEVGGEAEMERVEEQIEKTAATLNKLDPNKVLSARDDEDIPY